eukprot:scaffold4019_cov85-Isochrysis_galbana.AAC.2
MTAPAKGPCHRSASSSPPFERLVFLARGRQSASVACAVAPPTSSSAGARQSDGGSGGAPPAGSSAALAKLVTPASRLAIPAGTTSGGTPPGVGTENGSAEGHPAPSPLVAGTSAAACASAAPAATTRHARACASPASPAGVRLYTPSAPTPEP